MVNICFKQNNIWETIGEDLNGVPQKPIKVWLKVSNQLNFRT